MNVNGKSDRGQSRSTDRTTVSASANDGAEAIMPTGTASPPRSERRAARPSEQRYPRPMTEQPQPTEDQVEAIYQDPGLTRDEKIAAIAALYGITDPISAPDLFAHIRGFKPHQPAVVHE
jgi:hypothetical protein